MHENFSLHYVIVNKVGKFPFKRPITPLGEYNHFEYMLNAVVDEFFTQLLIKYHISVKYQCCKFIFLCFVESDSFSTQDEKVCADKYPPACAELPVR